MTQQEFLLEPEAVSEAIQSLLERPIHPQFTAYLGLKWTAAQENREHELEWDYSEFFDKFLKLPGGPREVDYYRPFWNEDASEEKAWFGSNIAGSYSPASISRISAIMKVIEVDKDAGTYSLRQDHWEPARQHLLYGSKVPVVPLAMFLYRDFALHLPSSPSFEHLTEIFRKDFGYPAPGRNEEFSHLYTEEWSRVSLSDCFSLRPSSSSSDAQR